LKALVDARIQGGAIVPGFTRKRTLGNRFWTREPATMRMAAKLVHGIEIGETKVCTPRQATGRGLPKEFVDANTDRKEGAAKIVAVDLDEARRAFRNDVRLPD